jgi:hypothetical protein
VQPRRQRQLNNKENPPTTTILSRRSNGYELSPRNKADMDSADAHENSRIVLSEADIRNGYVLPNQDNDAPAEAVRGYILEPDESDVRLAQHERFNALMLSQQLAAERRVLINETLQHYGFTGRVDIKSGVTSTIAVFAYKGDDQRILRLLKHGYIIVKLPPDVQDNLHAMETYKNEVTIIEQISHIESKSRPMLLTLNLNGIDFIFNSPIFYDEANFIHQHDLILFGDHVSQSQHDSDNDDSVESDALSNVSTENALSELIRQSFHNLSSYMTELAASEINPEQNFDLLFCSMLDAVNDLHKDGVLHLDLADRNFAILSDGTVMVVDFGMADMLNKVMRSSRNNHKFPSVSLMHNRDALMQENYLLDVRTDYISLQKTMLQAIANYCGINFYMICTQGLGDAKALGISSSELMIRYTDEQIINNTIFNIRSYALNLVNYDSDIGRYALKVLDKYMPFFMHIHDRRHGLDELRSANNNKFYQCTRHIHAARSRSNVMDTISHYHRMRQQQETDKPRPERSVSRSNVAQTARLFDQRAVVNNDNNSIPTTNKKT